MSPPATAATANTDSTLEQDLDELSSLLGGTLRGLKQASPPPQELLDAFTRGELGPRHMPALLSVAVAGPMSVSELSTRLGLGLSSTSAIVGQLSRAGLLERSEDESDRRRTIVRLHERDRQAIAPWAERALAPLRGTLERLSPPARAHFMEGWRILHEETTRVAGDDDAECLSHD
ncbi:MAG TPA: MarR family transcriptional regulator [Solirubrobacteraceae bacterium]|nr:MarR family transcriptional regulator [Solirubrobacteraceae bacterium]